MWQFDIKDWIAAFGVCFAAAALYLNYWQARRNSRFNRLAQEAAAFQGFGKRFAEFAAKREKLRSVSSSNEEEELKATYYEYWALQVEQWEYFRRAVVSEDTYLTWATHMFDAMRGTRRFGALTSRDSWKLVGVDVCRNTPDFWYLGLEVFTLSGLYSGNDAPLTAAELLDVRAKIRSLILAARKLGSDEALKAISLQEARNA